VSGKRQKNCCEERLDLQVEVRSLRKKLAYLMTDQNLTELELFHAMNAPYPKEPTPSEKPK